MLLTRDAVRADVTVELNAVLKELAEAVGLEEGEPVATGSGLAEIKASKFVGGDLTVNEAAFLAFSSHKAFGAGTEGLKEEPKN